jgi:DNA-binding CsgD family transcriptional regulator
VVVVDDVQLLDARAAAELRAAIRRGDGPFHVLTCRARARTADPVLRLWKDDGLPRIDLGPLPAGVVGELLAAALGERVDRATAADLTERSAGNVLFLRELVTAALRTGALTREPDGPWRLSGPIPVSDRIVELVEAALAGTALGELDRTARDYLEVVAYAEPVGRAELAVAGELSGDPGLGERLERAGLLVSGRDGRRLELRLCHPLYAEVLRTGTPALRATEIARRLAEAVEAAAGTGGAAAGAAGAPGVSGLRRRADLLRVAAWRLECGGAFAELLLSAADAARWDFDFPLAERLATAARDAGAGFEAGLLVGQLAGLQGRIREAERTFAALVDEAGTDDERGRLAIARLEMHAYDTGDLTDGLTIAEDAEASVTDPHWRDEITARRLGLLLALHGPSAQAAVAEPLVARASGRALAWGCVELTYSLGRLGRLDEALAVSERGQAVHESLADRFEWSPWMHRYLRCDILAHSGRLGAAEALAAELSGGGPGAPGDVETRAFFALHLAKVVGDRGHVRTAARHAETAIALFRRLGRQQMVRMGLLYLALARALSGQPAAAAGVLREFDDMGLPNSYLTGIDLPCVRAWTVAAAGELWDARTRLDTAAEEGIRIGDLVGAARLSELAAAVEGELIAARVAHVRGLLAGRAEDLLAVSESFEAMGADLLAAEAGADAAISWRRAGDTHRASAAEWRCEVLVARCGGVVTPALTGLDARARLTRAQREVALLAAAGCANREIADRLTLSVRTVENHLQQVYRKLGLHREELAARFGAGGPTV